MNFPLTQVGGFVCHPEVGAVEDELLIAYSTSTVLTVLLTSPSASSGAGVQSVALLPFSSLTSLY